MAKKKPRVSTAAARKKQPARQTKASPDLLAEIEQLPSKAVAHGWIGQLPGDVQRQLIQIIELWLAEDVRVRPKFPLSQDLQVWLSEKAAKYGVNVVPDTTRNLIKKVQRGQEKAG